MTAADTGHPVVVVAGVIERAGRFLVARRPPGSHLAGCWEFPGGKCLPAEAHDEALRRELAEELGIAASVGERLHVVTHAYPEKTVELHFYRCTFTGEPQPLDGQTLMWASRTELTSLEFPAADADLIRALASA